MPDISDVENTLVEVVADILNPGAYIGTTYYQPETIMTSQVTVTTSPGPNTPNVQTPVRVRLFRGSPVPDNLKLDVKAGIAEVSVFQVSGMYRFIPGYFDNEYVSSTVPITFTATVQGLNQVLFGGTATAGQVTGVAIGASIIEDAYCIRLNNTDTPAGIAATLASIIPGASAVGPLLTVPSVHNLIAGVVSDSTVNNEVGLQSQMFDIHIWSPNAQIRDVLGSAIVTGMVDNNNILFWDNSTSQTIYPRGTWSDDMAANTGAWHRYERYEIIYPTVKQTISPGILFLGIRLNGVRLIGEFDYRSAP